MTKVLFIIIITVIFISFFRLGSITLFDVDEAIFAEATKEMVQGGDWITPVYDGENRYDKPILFYWLMAGSYKVFGINEFGARFPSALASFFLALSVFFFVRRFSDEKGAIYAAGSLVLSMFFLAYSHAAVTDMTLTLFITLSLSSFYLSLNEKRSYIYGFYIFSALAFLTKGLIGVLFPFGIAVIYLSVTEGTAGIKKVFNLKGVVLFLVFSAPWCIAQIATNGREFVQQFFIKHHFARYTGVISGHRGPFYYYIPVLLAGLFPWIAFLPAGIRNVFDRGNLELRTFNSRVSLFALIWFVFIFVFFSFSTTKLPNYVLPAIPAIAILISSGMHEQDKWRRYSNVFISVMALVLSIGFVLLEKYISRLGDYDTGWTIAATAIMIPVTALGIYAVFTGKGYYHVLSFLMIIFFFILLTKVLPDANQYLQGTLYRYSLYAKDRLHQSEAYGGIIAYRINNPSIVFYSDHKVINVRDRNKLLPFLSDNRILIAISKMKDVETLKVLGFNLLENDGRYALLERK